MPLTSYKYKDGESFSHAIAEGFRNAGKCWGIPGAASGAGQYIKDNKLRTALFSVAVASVVFTAMHMKAGFVSAAEASGFLAKTASYFVGTNQAIAASLPGFIGTGVAGQIVAGAIMTIAAAAVLYGTYQIASKLKDVAVEAYKGKEKREAM
ncbi:hypothetical protein Wcon_00198 [Wolbachia endosymbiont of Cylisticus convexus]|uniref:hypothetical protein n=1 Tax=Wolbachia endosymbiont of Cylisticus convexus TaxID=118728 RepID=UPI000DF6BA22|nr:hypothetical protein [Wolbachia endosymbiont of Cylisticus convexus]RDD35611.1 hypothetical protein Wcon_00198 [Wolbachia endosymbiont of Cylisticus convexus]